MKVNAVLTIAGSDCSGGAGIQADLKTIEAYQLYGMSVITAVTAQNTMGVSGIHALSADFVTRQLTAVFDDIPPQAVKIGMLHDADIIAAVSDFLQAHCEAPIIVDPVMVSTSGHALLSEQAVSTLIEKLCPLCTLITPNLAEAAVLTGQSVNNQEQMEQAAQKILQQFGCAVYLKGGHLTDCADDFLLTSDGAAWFSAPRLENPNTHGTGCTLSSAIACGLAKNLSLLDSIQCAKNYLTDCINEQLDLGHGAGPLQHQVTPRIP